VRISQLVLDSLAIEEPLEIRLEFGTSGSRQTKSISVTIGTPGNDLNLAAGFHMIGGVIHDANDIEQIAYAGHPFSDPGQSRSWVGLSFVPSRIPFERSWQRVLR
jgi:formate dehydrogenase assembly factor FdhD